MNSCGRAMPQKGILTTASWWSVSVQDSLVPDSDEEQARRMVLSTFDSSRSLHQFAESTNQAWLPGLLVVFVARFSSVVLRYKNV